MAGNSRPNGFVLDLEPEAAGLGWGALGKPGKQCCPILKKQPPIQIEHDRTVSYRVLKGMGLNSLDLSSKGLAMWEQTRPQHPTSI